MRAALVADFVKFDLRMPHFHGSGRALTAGLDERSFPLADLQTKQPLAQAEHPAEHAIDGEIGTQFLLVEIEQRLAPLFGPKRHIPWLQQ